MRKDYHLCASLSAPANLMDRMISSETVHAGEGIIENNDLLTSVWVLFQLCEEECQRQCAPIPGA
jgi:hypothetical protein